MSNIKEDKVDSIVEAYVCLEYKMLLEMHNGMVVKRVFGKERKKKFKAAKRFELKAEKSVLASLTGEAEDTDEGEGRKDSQALEGVRSCELRNWKRCREGFPQTVGTVAGREAYENGIRES